MAKFENLESLFELVDEQNSLEVKGGANRLPQWLRNFTKPQVVHALNSLGESVGSYYGGYYQR